MSGFSVETGFCLKKLDRYETEFYKNSKKLGRNDEWLNLEMAECLEKLKNRRMYHLIEKKYLPWKIVMSYL